MSKSEANRFVSRPLVCWTLEIVCLVALAGCTTDQKQPTTRPSNFADRAATDPFNYSPTMGDPDISGGSLGNYDNNAMKRDIDHVLNP